MRSGQIVIPSVWKESTSEMEKMLREIRERVMKNIEEARAGASLEQIRVGVLGKKGELTALLRGMGKLPPEERPRSFFASAISCSQSMIRELMTFWFQLGRAFCTAR